MDPSYYSNNQPGGTMKRDLAKQVKRTAEQPEEMHELTLEDLDVVAGGKGATLFKACCTGQHIPKVKIEI
jgi:type VI protein secretion system component Hcp